MLRLCVAFAKGGCAAHSAQQHGGRCSDVGVEEQGCGQGALWDSPTVLPLGSLLVPLALP